MGGCEDIDEADERDDGEGQQVCVSMVVCRRQRGGDRIEDARKMRWRIEEYRRRVSVEIAVSKGSDDDCESKRYRWLGETESSSELGGKKALRRKTSKFTEVGCTLGDESVEDLTSLEKGLLGTQVESRKVFAGYATSVTTRKDPYSKSAKGSKSFWVRRILGL